MSLRSIGDDWRNRPARERWMIGAPVVALLAVGLYLGAWEPLDASARRLRASLPELALQRDAILSQAEALRSPGAGTPAPALRTTAIAAALERRQLGGARFTIEPSGTNRARLAAARVPFHAVWPLLQDLQNEQGLRVVSLRIDRVDASFVRVEATLGAGER